MDAGVPSPLAGEGQGGGMHQDSRKNAPSPASGRGSAPSSPLGLISFTRNWRGAAQGCGGWSDQVPKKAKPRSKAGLVDLLRRNFWTAGGSGGSGRRPTRHLIISRARSGKGSTDSAELVAMSRLHGTAQMVPVPARNKHMNQFSPAGLIGRDVTQGEIPCRPHSPVRYLLRPCPLMRQGKPPPMKC
jgi:hypothetical protein